MKPIVKKIGIIVLYVLLSGVLGAYFYFSTLLIQRDQNHFRCQSILITIQDGNSNPLVNEDDVRSHLAQASFKLLGNAFDSINLNSLESELARFSAIKQCNAVKYINGDLQLYLRQHLPNSRIIAQEADFFLTKEGFLFPTVNPNRQTALPVFMDIPISYPNTYRGSIAQTDTFLMKINQLASYIQHNGFWKEQAKGIAVRNRQQVEILPAHDSLCLSIGSSDGYLYKMDKLQAFYKVILPSQDSAKYASVDARFGDQVVCTYRKGYKKKTNKASL